MTSTWTIHQTERNAETGFIFNVHWRYAVSDKDENKTYYADMYAIATFTQDPNSEAEELIPFEEITDEKIVIEWVKAYLGKEKLAEMHKTLIAKIEAEKNPPVLSGLPWEVNNELTTNTNNNE